MNAAPLLDPLALPLQGQYLIEASAGTGKTFTMALLYLRLLLGLDSPARPPLRVDQILVVTFTEAATQELRERIRRRIRELYQLCVTGPGEDAALNALLTTIDNRPSAAQRLLAAERQLDEAAISTIHGFCQRMLIQQAIEAGSPFSQTLMTNEQPLQQQAVADFWRRHFYPLSTPVARVIQHLWAEPEALLRELAPYLAGDLPLLITHSLVSESIEARHQRLIACIGAVKMQWQQQDQAISVALDNAGLNKRRYPARYLKQWISHIDAWAQQPTEDYQLPEVLVRFRASSLCSATSQSDLPHQVLFNAIDDLYQQPLTLRDLVIAQALPAIREEVARSKQHRGEVAFDDLLRQLDQALQGPEGAALAAAIRQRYPAALIDEFQDTDPQQYRIFRTIYRDQPATLLLLIGDPKQAIYAFRGADIFTYIQARRTLPHHYTLRTNWRSANTLITAVNRLFGGAVTPFIFDQDIPFVPMQAPEPSAPRQFMLRGTPQAALQLHYLSHPLPATPPAPPTASTVTLQQYRQIMADHCAAHISHWLTADRHQQALLVHADSCRSVTAADIAVLVRTSDEASAIRQALSALAIPSVYLSERQSLFTTLEAQELLRLLQALLNPLQAAPLRAALAGTLFALDASALDQLIHDDQAWEQLLSEFTDYQQQWQQHGVLPMLQQLLCRRNLAAMLLATPEGERRLTDLRHLGELLQEAAQQLESPAALVRWLSQQIAKPSRDVNSQQLRLESDRPLVKIITIHKAKGLEYPLVWLPFPCAFRQPIADAYYHDRQTQLATLNLCEDPQAKQWAEQERLAEEIRLLYVALTRAIFHCSVGVAPVVSGRRKQSESTDLHRSALGYLLQQGESGDVQRLYQALATLQCPEIAALPLETLPPAVPLRSTRQSPPLSARQVTRKLTSQWRVTSYSGLHRPPTTPAIIHANNANLVENASSTPGEDDRHGESSVRRAAPTAFSGAAGAHYFPRGAAAGSFLHHLLQYLDVSTPLDQAWLTAQINQQGFDPQWQPLLQQWLPAILQTPLNDQGLCLQQLAADQKQAEMHFYLPISGLLQAAALERLMRRYDPLSQQAATLTFQQVHGMLQGFIDLVFCWQGRYYLLDYKSNWLGDSITAYQPAVLAAAMCQHRYDLQYQLYTLALHRYLRHRVPNYRYQTHFAGIFYLFLRGMTGETGGSGVFFYRPAAELITLLDAQFANGKFANGNNADVDALKTG